MKWTIPFFDLRLGPEEKDAVLEVLRSNWLTTGPKIAEFESAFANAMEPAKSQAVAVSNCTVALHLALAALGVSEGDEVICPSLTFVATANAIRYTGAKPVFADICSDLELNLDPYDVEVKISQKTKVVLVMHYGGYPCRMGEILDLARRYGIKIVEDASHGPLGEWETKKIGTIGDVGCFSFFSNKNMTTGEGGMVVTEDVQLAYKIRAMRSHGMTSSTFERFKGHAFGYDVTMLGYNYRMDEIRAAIGVEQLKKLSKFNQRRKLLVESYRDAIRLTLPYVTIPFDKWNGCYGYHIFPVLLPVGYADRHKLMERLSQQGIQTSIHYRPVHSFTAYEEFRVELPRTEAIASRLLSLPLFPTLELNQVDDVVAALKRCL